MALNRNLLDRYQGIGVGGQGIPMGDPFSARQAGIAREVENARLERESYGDDVNARVRASIGKLPGMGPWAGYFGMLQNREDLVNAAGGEMKVDFRSRNAGAGLRRAVQMAGKR